MKIAPSNFGYKWLERLEAGPLGESGRLLNGDPRESPKKLILMHNRANEQQFLDNHSIHIVFLRHCLGISRVHLVYTSHILKSRI